MSKHGDGKKRRLQATPPSREGDQDRHRDSADSGQRIGVVANLPASPASLPSWTMPTPEQIAVRAYENWEARGKPAGTDREDWFEADRQLQEDTKHPSLENVPDKEKNLAEIGRHRLSDAGERAVDDVAESARRFAAAEQTREAEESAEARSAGASNRERMVDIGRGNQQAGRQGQ